MKRGRVTPGPWSAGALAAALLIAATCTHDKSGEKGASIKTQPEQTSAVLLRARGRTIRVKVEVVRTPETRARGLMYRRELAADAGMLFIFERQETQSFWMKNTYLPLDMIFIDDERRVVGVVHDAEPLTTTSRSVDEPSRYVLEVNAGFARRHGVATGTVVTFEGVTFEGMTFEGL